MDRMLGLVAVLGLVALAPAAHAFTTVQPSGVNTSNGARLADPDDLMQQMQDERQGGTVSLPGGSGSLQFQGSSSSIGGVDSKFVPEPGSAYVPSMQH